MSGQANIQELFNRPITLDQFSQAIKELPVDALTSERQRLQNSVSHLERSNGELEKAAQSSEDEEEKGIYKDAVDENKQVIQQQYERIQVIKNRLVQLGIEHVEIEDDKGLYL